MKPAADNVDFISCNSSSGQGAVPVAGTSGVSAASSSSVLPSTSESATAVASGLLVEGLFGSGSSESESEPVLTTDGSACFGISAVLRMTFALFLIHVLIMFLILPRNSCAAVIHDGGWCCKFFLAIGLFIGFFWIPISFFSVWATISRWVGILFLVIQVLYVLAGAITFNEFMVGAEDENQ